MIFFAHAGHDHPEPTVSPEILIAISFALGLIILWLATTYIIKMHLPHRILLILAALLVAGMATYQVAPIVSMVAITVGIISALGVTLLQLVADRRS